MNASMRSSRRCRALAACLLLAWPLASVAAQPPAGSGEPDVFAASPGTGEGVAGKAALGEVLAEDALAGLRGGQAVVVVSVDNQGMVSGNSASDLVSGNNQVGDGAFANAAGLSTVIQNSGSNVLIQNGTAVNVRFGDPGR